MKKALVIIPLILIAVIGVYVYWNYLRIDEDGVRAGKVQKFSRKGQVFKTYEGELLGGGFGRQGSNFQAQYFYFSVEDPQIAAFIEQNAEKNMTLHFVKYEKSLPWRGENYGKKNQEPGQYIVDKATLNEVNTTNQSAEEGNPIPY